MKLSPAVALAVVAVAFVACGDEPKRASGPPPSELTTERVARPPDVGGTSDASQAEPRPDKPEPEPKAGEGEIQFTIAIDNDAIAADDLIDRALDGENVAGSLVRVRERVTRRINKRLLEGKGGRPGAELLRSALTSAISAARSSDLPRLVRIRADIRDARAVISRG